MRHANTNRKFGREKNQRHALLRSLARALILHERMETTEAKAKEIRPFVEKLVTKARGNSVATHRLLMSTLGGGQDVAVKKLLNTLAPRFKERPGGYTRIVKLPQRMSDGARMAVIEFV
jgi:large subunit ribosomal protein L17